MGKNIIVCSDGTGNTFVSHGTNVTRLIKYLALDDRTRQVAIYDQGIGTTAQRCSEVERLKNSLKDPGALLILPPPVQSDFWPQALVQRGRGLLFGYGLKENVHEMYQTLCSLYDGPDDRVFLFGFSRGAFTVRALAGLLYRCHLPPREGVDVSERFERAWALFIPIHEDETATREFRSKQRPCSIHLLGIWDTVKSYGGLRPVMLPHLRHNPIVKHVRHALALHERRAWFQATTWGQLDLDRKGAMLRLKEEDCERYKQQDIDEVWFVGCHSDIGGGAKEEITARIALRWMLGEAVNVEHGIRLNREGEKVLIEDDPPGQPEIHESWNRRWWAAEQIWRNEIDNSGRYPVLKRAWGSNGKRKPNDLRRCSGTVYLHATVGSTHTVPGKTECRKTKSMPRKPARSTVAGTHGLSPVLERTQNRVFGDR